MDLRKLLFELGSIQVFTIFSAQDYMAGKEYRDVYWQDRVSQRAFGPFPDIHSCMTHYTTVIATQKKQIIGEEFQAQVILVDFKNKVRINGYR